VSAQNSPHRFFLRSLIVDNSSIRPYRAPELVFASRSYNPAAIDLWALATTISELFRPFASTAVSSSASTSEEDDPYHELEDRSSRDPPAPRRQSLFTSGASDFVLSASIFKVLGTPTLDSWPVSPYSSLFNSLTWSDSIVLG